MSRLPLEQMMASLRPLPAWSSKLGTMGVLMTVSSRVPATWSDAAAGLGQTGDVGHLLGRLLGEQRELVLGRKAADGLHPPGGGGLALRGEVLAQDLQDLPVLGGELDADRGGELGGQVVVPLGRVGQEALGVDVHLASGDGGHRHGVSSLTGRTGCVRRGWWSRWSVGGACRSWTCAVSSTHLRAHETRHELVCRLL